MRTKLSLDGHSDATDVFSLCLDIFIKFLFRSWFGLEWRWTDLRHRYRLVFILHPQWT